MSGSVNVVDLVDDYRAGLSLPDLALKYGMSISGARQHVLKAGALRSRTDALRLAAAKGKLKQRGPRGPMSEEGRQNIAAARRKWGAENAAGISLKANGYLEYTTGEHKGRSVHVVKMEKRIGRRLLPDEQVHHIDGNKTNNHDNNLALMTRAGHARLHRREDALSGNHRERDENGRLR